MGASKREFNEMREEEMYLQSTYNFPQLTKKEVQMSAVEAVKHLVEDGEKDVIKELSNVVRAKEFLTTYEKELRNEVKDNLQSTHVANKVEFSVKNGASKLNYKEDPVWRQINRQLKDREELLKVAEKSEAVIYDSEGIEVPKVSRTQSGEVLNIKF